MGNRILKDEDGANEQSRHRPKSHAKSFPGTRCLHGKINFEKTKGKTCAALETGSGVLEITD